MLDNIVEVLKQQPDLSCIRKISFGEYASLYRGVVKSSQGKKKQLIRVIHDIRNYHAIKREKDLLVYLNQFSEFSRFNEIRKVGFYYLLFFEESGRRTLTKHVKKKGPLSSKKAKLLLTHMVKALENVHQLGFVQGTICPDSIVIGKQRSRLIDWSRALPVRSSFDSELITGDMRYCPPEQLNGILDEKSDVYTLGCTLYFALTGKHIYLLKKSSEGAHQLWAHVHHTVRRLNRLPIFWRYLILWMTQKDPEKRPTLQELMLWIQDETVPDWIRKKKIVVESAFPEDALSQLADEHYLYPMFKQALHYESTGDLENAFNLYENGAFRGYSRAENNLGLMYEKGIPVRQSYVMAANMYEQAYRKGNPFAAYNLARLFEKGLGVSVNVTQAFRLYEFSALRGHLSAQYALGLMYEKGIGVSQNLEQARYWYHLAAHYGHNASKLAFNRVCMAVKKP